MIAKPCMQPAACKACTQPPSTPPDMHTGRRSIRRSRWQPASAGEDPHREAARGWRRAARSPVQLCVGLAAPCGGLMQTGPSSVAFFFFLFASRSSIDWLTFVAASGCQSRCFGIHVIVVLCCLFLKVCSTL